MAEYTLHFNLPYPEGQDAVAVHADLEQLAKKADLEVQNVKLDSDTNYSLMRNSVESAIHFPANMFNQEDVTSGMYYPAGSGTPEPSASFILSGWIPVTAGQPYTYASNEATPVLRLTYFNDQRDYVGFLNGLNYQSFTHNAPAEASWVRLSFPRNRLDSLQMNHGHQVRPYDKGGYATLRVNSLPELPARVIPDGAVTPHKTSFFHISTNLFVQQDVVAGMFYPSGSGSPEPSANWNISGWIQVTGGEPYTYTSDGSTPGLRLTYFNDQQEYETSVGFPAQQTFTHTAPFTAAWVRITFAPSRRETLQMNHGTTALPYEPGGTEKLRPEYVPDIHQLAGTLPVLDMPLDGVFTTNHHYDDQWEVISDSTPQDLYDRYDALVTEDPDYIFRTHLGDVDGQPIYRYDLMPPYPRATSSYKPEPVKIVVVAGTHGHEKGAPWTLLHFVENLTRNWHDDPLLEALRFNCHFVLIPVVNPTGYLATTRTNHAGVDINRNWPTGWAQGEPGDVTYGGPEPLSEQETRNINDLLTEDDTPHIFVDFHNFGRSPNGTEFLWPIGGTNQALEVSSALVRRVDRHWKKAHPEIPQDPQVTMGYVGAAADGTGARHAAEVGVPLPYTFETCTNVDAIDGSTIYNANATTMAYEAWVNFIALAAHAATK